MKKLILLALAFVLIVGIYADVIIGTGTSNQRQPFGSYWGYERSASIYTAGEINATGTITHLEWYVGSANATNIPTKIYVTTTPNATMTATAWDDMVSGLTPVFDGTLQFNATGWQQIDITDFPYNHQSSGNLLVICETNYGGGGSGSYPQFRYTSGATGKHQTWNVDNNPPTTNTGTINALRPNITLVGITDTNPPSPATVSSPADQGTNIAITTSLSWTAGGGAPTGYDVYFGQTLPTEGNPNVSHTVQTTTTWSPGTLAYSTTYYWKIVPHNAYGDAGYANCPTWSFTTREDPTKPIPYTQDFNSGTSLAAIDWTGNMSIMSNHGTNGSNGLYRNLWGSATSANAETPIVGPMVTNSQLMFDYRYVNYTGYPSTPLTLVAGDKLEIQVAPEGGTFTTIHTIDQNNHVTSTDFANVIVPISGYAGQTIQVKFLAARGAGDYYLDIDNVTIRETPAGGVLVVSPSPVAMGTGYVGFSKTQQVALTNTGVAALTVNSIALASTVDFQLQNLPTLPVTINPGDPAVPFTVVFTPTTAGELSTQLLIGDTRANSSINVTGTGVQPLEGEICENPYIVTLPLVDYDGTTEGYANDYTSAMFTGLTSASYVNGKDWVAKITVPTLGNLNITLANQTGAPAYQYMGMFLVNTIPSLASPAAVLAQAYGTAPFSIANYNATPGDYYLIIDNWPTPDNIYFTLNISFVEATDPPSPATLVAPADEAIGVSATPTLSWTSGGGVVEKYYVSYGTVSPFTTVLNNHDNGTATTYAITSPLNYETEYWWKVSPWNSVAGYAENQATWTFTTLTNPTISSFPFFEGFESGYTNGASVLGNWSQLVGPEYSSVYWTANNTETTYNRSPRTGNWNATLRYNGESTLVRPIQLEAGTGYQIEFYARQDTGTSTAAKIQAKLGNAPTLAALTTQIVPQTELVAGDYQKISGVFSVATSGVYYIGIHGWLNITPWYISLDDIKISEMIAGPPAIPTLTYPADTATNMPADGFNLTWEPDLDTGGEPNYYAVFMSQDEETIFDDFYFEVEDPFFNPVTDSEGEIEFAYEDRWYWTVAAGNSHGESDPAAVRSFQIEADPTITSFPWYDGFESYADFSLDLRPWSQYDGDGMTTWGIDGATFPNQYYVGSFIAFNPSATTPALSAAWAAHGGSKYAAAFDANGDANDDWLISPPILSPGNLKFGFWARSITDQYGMERFKVLVSTTDKNPASFTQISDGIYTEAPAAWTKYEYPLNVPANQIFYLAIQCVSDDAFAFFVDDVELVIPQGIDLAINGFTGDSLGQVNSPAVYEVTVANVGLNDVSSYYVYLKDNENNSTVAIMNVAELLEAGTSTVHEISWTPAIQGEYGIYAEVSTAGDGNLSNNTAAPIHLTVYAETMQMLYVGDPNTEWVSWAMPFVFYYEDGVVETIYLASEMQATSGTIEALVYENNFSAAEVDEFQIWMKNTDATDLVSGWLPWDGYTMVYEGLAGGPAGNNYIQFPITPFNYTGGNLAIRISRTWSATWSANTQRWWITIDENYPNRSRLVYQDADLDIANPPVGSATNNIPNIMFFMDTEDLVTTVVAPEISISDLNVDWDAVPYAYSYKVYASDDPYLFGTEPTATVYTNSYTPDGVERAEFYKITASTYRDFARGSFNRPAHDRSKLQEVDQPVFKQPRYQRSK